MTAAKHLTPQDLADRLGYSIHTIYAMNRDGTGPRIFRPGGGKRGRVLYRLADVERWENSRLAPTP